MDIESYFRKDSSARCATSPLRNFMMDMGIEWKFNMLYYAQRFSHKEANADTHVTNANVMWMLSI